MHTLSRVDVSITAHVTDTDTDGLRRVSAFVVSHAGDMGWYAGIDDVPGTHDATFQFTANVPQGTPPGTYYIEISAVDASHTVNFMSPDDPNAQHSPGVMITSQQGDPTFTVVQHQG